MSIEHCLWQCYVRFILNYAYVSYVYVVNYCLKLTHYPFVTSAPGFPSKEYIRSP